MNPSNPVKLYAEVKLSGVPVIWARVTARIRVIDLRGVLTQPFDVQLLDNGNGGKGTVKQAKIEHHHSLCLKKKIG